MVDRTSISGRMTNPHPHVTFVTRLRRRGLLIKRAVLVSVVLFAQGGTVAHADARQPCPPLQVEQSCTPEGAAVLTLRAGAAAPAQLSYIVSLQIPGQKATTLAPGGVMTLSVPAPKGQQVTLAVVGLEPDGTDMAACCLSNQRLHLPTSCAADAPARLDPDPDPVAKADTPPLTADDLGVTLALAPDCAHTSAGVVCSGQMQIDGADGPAQTLTLQSDNARTVRLSGGTCTDFVKGFAICHLPPGQPWPLDLDLQLPAVTGPQQTQLCARIGVSTDPTVRTLALQDALDRAGYRVGKVDGDFGPATLAALADFMADAGLPPVATEIPAEALVLLGLDDHGDANPANDTACDTANVPKAPVVCDARTTRASGAECACRFKGMVRASMQSCACPKGQKLGPKGCVRPTENTGDTKTSPTGTTLACDPATTVLRNGRCECRAAGMVRATATACVDRVEIAFCPNGLPQIPGIPCAQSCARTNAAGECCDLLGPGDASCR